MEKKDVISELERYNRWRRGEGYGEDYGPLHPTVIGIIIDEAVKFLKGEK